MIWKRNKSPLITIPSLSKHEQQALDNQWAKEAEPLLLRDGHDHRFPGGGDRIAQNILLVAAIDEIRKGYMILFNERMAIFQPKARTILAEKWLEVVKKIDTDIMLYTKASLDRLRDADYGFTPEQKEAIMAFAPLDYSPRFQEKFDDQNAARILGSIIRHSVDTFTKVFNCHKGVAKVSSAPVCKPEWRPPTEDNGYAERVRAQRWMTNPISRN